MLDSGQRDKSWLAAGGVEASVEVQKFPRGRGLRRARSRRNAS